MALTLFLLQALLSDSDTEHLMAVETSIPKGAILDMLEASYIKLIDEGKSLICRVFIEAEAILFCLYVEFHVI